MEQLILNGLSVDQLLEKISHLLDSKLSKISNSEKEEKSHYLSRKEVAKLLKITLPTLHDWTKLGWLRSYKIGTRVLYKPDEIKEAIEKVSINKHKKYLK
jgi:excisionase family DNA binding protein